MLNGRKKFEIQEIDPNELIPWERNPRKHNIPALKESIERFGFRNVIVVNKRTNIIEAGHGRAQAAIDLGIDSVPVLFVDDDDETATAYTIADNRQSDLGGWDDTALLPLLVELQKAGDAIYGTGYDEEDIEDLLRRVESLEESEFDINAEWAGMPEFVQNNLSWKSLVVHFASEEDYEAFAKLISQDLTTKTRGIWYPQAEVNHLSTQRYITEV